MSETAVDRFTMDILREGFAAITDEMFVSLQRTSQSPIIYEVLDFGVGISDARGELVSQGNGVAGFLGPLSDAVRETVTRAAASAASRAGRRGRLRSGRCAPATSSSPTIPTPAAARTCPMWP